MNKAFIAVGATIILAVATVTPALAWHPKADIVKKVQNQTAGGALSDANDAAHAVATKPGDILKYVIEVSNIGDPDSRGYNDMAKTVMTDTLPTGIELLSNPSQRTITENLGTLKPGQKVTKEYQVKVVSTTNDAAIKNTACVTGNSTANDNPQKDCDDAVVTVKVPVDEPKKEVLPAETSLPATGPEGLLAGTAGVGALGYGVHAFVRSRRAVRGAYKR